MPDAQKNIFSTSGRAIPSAASLMGVILFFLLRQENTKETLSVLPKYSWVWKLGVEFEKLQDVL